MLTSKKHLTEWIGRNSGDPKENWCGLEGEEALKQSLNETMNKNQERRRNFRRKRNWKGGTARMYSITYTLQLLLGRFNEELFPVGIFEVLGCVNISGHWHP